MPMHLDLGQHLAALVRAGAALRDAAAAGLDSRVPTCPRWDVRALVTHQGMVHRWAAAQLRRDRAHRTDDSTAEAAAAPDLLAWFSDGVAALVDTIRATPPDAEASTFLRDAPPPRHFWTRRQAHETAIHGVDAVAAGLGRWPTEKDVAIEPALAADGVDELLCGFITRGSKANSIEPVVVHVRTDDTGHAWTVRIGDAAMSTTVGQDGPADATWRGTAVQLYLGLWNRGDEITVEGREDVLATWRRRVRVCWRGA
jgi:uncharacterized protein (TIGR03083 family)